MAWEGFPDGDPPRVYTNSGMFRMETHPTGSGCRGEEDCYMSEVMPDGRFRSVCSNCNWRGPWHSPSGDPIADPPQGTGDGP